MHYPPPLLQKRNKLKKNKKNVCKPWASRVAWSWLPGEMHVRWLTTLQSGREGSHPPSPHCPKFNQDWMMWKHQKETISYNTFTGCLGNKAAHRTPLLFGSAGTHGRTGGVIYGIWCVWIRFCSWLWQGVGVGWVTVQNEWFLHICASKANVGPTWFVSVRRKDTKQTRRVNSLRRGSKRTGLVTFFFLLLFFLHEEESSIPMQQRHYSKVLERSEHSSCLSQYSSDHSSNLCFQMALKKIPEKRSSSVLILLSP